MEREAGGVAVALGVGGAAAVKVTQGVDVELGAPLGVPLAQPVEEREGVEEPEAVPWPFVEAVGGGEGETAPPVALARPLPLAPRTPLGVMLPLPVPPKPAATADDVKDALTVGDCVTLPVAGGEPVAEAEGVPPPEGHAVGDCERDGASEVVRDSVGDAQALTEGAPLTVAAPLPLTVAEGVGDVVAVAAAVGLVVPSEGVPRALPLAPGERLPVPLTEAQGENEGEAPPVRLAEPLGDAEAHPEGVPLPRSLGGGVGEARPVADAEALCVPVPEREGEAEAEAQGGGDRVPLAQGVGDAEVALVRVTVPQIEGMGVAPPEGDELLERAPVVDKVEDGVPVPVAGAEAVPEVEGERDVVPLTVAPADTVMGLLEADALPVPPLDTVPSGVRVAIAEVVAAAEPVAAGDGVAVALGVADPPLGDGVPDAGAVTDPDCPVGVPEPLRAAETVGKDAVGERDAEGEPEALVVGVAPTCVALPLGEPEGEPVGAPRVAVAAAGNEKVPPPHRGVAVRGADAVPRAEGDEVPLREGVPKGEGEPLPL